MKKIFLRFAILSLLLYAGTRADAQVRSVPPNGDNQKSLVRQYIGSFAWVEISYSSPDVAGREGQIWGQLVPYGLTSLGFGTSTPENPSPWRAGANENTTIEFSHDMQVQGEDIPAGKYGFHIIPQETGPWTLIFSSENQAWGSFFYDPAQDVLRVEATPEEADFHEYLTYEFTVRKAEETTVALMWEKKKIPFAISLPNAAAQTLAAIEGDLKGSTGFTWNSWVQASGWALGAGFKDKALEWADAAISTPFVGQRNFNTLQNKAAVLRAMGKRDEALALMDEAIRFQGVGVFQIHAYGRQLIADGEKDKALEVFKFNYDQNKGTWPTNYGLARGYSSLGDYKKALKYLKIAQTMVPEGDTLNASAVEANIAKLEKGEDIN